MYKNPRARTEYQRQYDETHKEHRRELTRIRKLKKIGRSHFQRLSEKQRSWVRRMYKGLSPDEAAKRAGYANPIKTISKNKNNPVIGAAIQSWLSSLEKKGVNSSYMAERIKTIMDKTTPVSPSRQDSNTLKAIELTHKITQSHAEGVTGMPNINIIITPAEAKFMSKEADAIEITTKES